MENNNRSIYGTGIDNFIYKNHIITNMMWLKDLKNKIKNKKLNEFNIEKDCIMRNSFTFKSTNTNNNKQHIIINNSKHKSINNQNLEIDNSITYEYTDFLISVDMENNDVIYESKPKKDWDDDCVVL